jgi:Fic family protein
MVDGSSSGFSFTSDLLRELHRLTIQDLYDCAGTFRRSNVVLLRNGVIDNSKHQPPPWEQVEQLVQDLCNYINNNFGKSAVHLAAYAMWRINWVHPFMGGNGRTSRGASYLVLNVRMGFNLPGLNTIAQQIETNRAGYYAALEVADQAFAASAMDISVMEALISQLLAAQLLSVHDKATQS